MGLPEGAAFSEGLATEGTEFTERFFLLPSRRQPLLQPGYVEMEKTCASVFSVTSVAGLFSAAVVRKGRWRSAIGVAIGIGIGIEWTRDRIAWRSRFFGGLSHRGHRVHGEILPFAIDGTTLTSAGLR
jgi:hypothetical protein